MMGTKGADGHLLGTMVFLNRLRRLAEVQLRRFLPSNSGIHKY
jgi:hypothetical protein